MVRVWTASAPWQVSIRTSSRSWSLVLYLVLLGEYSPNTALPEAQRSDPSPGYSINDELSPATEQAVPLPLLEYGNPNEAFDGPFSERSRGPRNMPNDSPHLRNGEEHIDILGSAKEEPALSRRQPTTNSKNLRLGESTELMQSPSLSQIVTNSESSGKPPAVEPEPSSDGDIESEAPSVAPSVWREHWEHPTDPTLRIIPESKPQSLGPDSLGKIEDQNSSALEESADLRSAFERSRNFASFGEGVSIPSPLAHSLLYRTRDIANPLNLANFLAEGQEWLIPGSGNLLEGLGRRVDSLFSGLFLKTASILPDYKRNVIICYKEYKPSMWIEMFGIRNQFLRQLASLFQGTHRMQSVYLRNLGMEIFEVPPLWRVGEFVATVLKLKNFVSHVYTDHLVTDFDNEAQEPVQESDGPQEFLLHSDGSKGHRNQGKTGYGYLEKRRTASAPASQHRTDTAPTRRLEVTTNDPFTWQQWAIMDSGPSRWGIEAPKAWDIWTGNGLKPRFTVAVIDSGVDYEHPDLKNQIWRNPDEICGNGIDDDFNGFVDDCIGWDFVKGTNMPMDENGHGTASAGIIAAEPNNGIGLTGVCWGCDILVLKALNEDIKGTISAFARSLDYAIGKRVVLSNNSYGGRGSGFKGLEEAVQRARQAGMIIVAAAGNYNGNNDNDKQPVFPASYDLDNVVSVAAISRNGQLAPFSSYGKKQVDIAAPGANIMTTAAQKSYRSVSGTSFAVPMITGTLALLWTRRPHLQYQQVIQRLLRSVKKNPHLEGLIATGGTVDAWNMLANEDLLDPYAASPVLPTTCASTSCSPYASCTDLKGVARCVCNRGFEGDGKFCKDIDECLFSPCGPASVCVNTVGSYQCKCRKGFQQTQEACIDIDECALGMQKLIPLPCPLQARCYNFSGTFDCICPQGTVWNAISGPTAQCLRINSPGRGPCIGNGGCGANALCQAFFTPGEATRKCTCVGGFKPLRIDNQEVAVAMANSLMSSFDNTVCIREEVLPEEQAYYLISMHRERLRYMRESPSTGRIVSGHSLSSSGQTAARPHASLRTGQSAEHYLSPIPSVYIPTPLAAGRLGQSWAATSAATMPASPGSPQAKMSYGGSSPHVSAAPLLLASSSQPIHPEKQRVVSQARSSCLLGVCFR